MSFYISTVGISRDHETVNIVSTYRSAAKPAFQDIKYAALYKAAVDDRARAALNLEANGVIWIRFEVHNRTVMEVHLFAAGTEVK
ncbi:MAG TPA: hypothetical protein VNM92_15780 [Thermoanaerobaculia bacterium]|nr:hypothetical protein [Thermoanaerobaculia bacterium]